MNWFMENKSVCGLFERKRGPSPEDDDGDKEDGSGDNRHCCSIKGAGE